MLTLLLILSLQAPPRAIGPRMAAIPGGARFSPLTQITRANVAQLQVAWTYHTGMPDMSSMSHRPPALEVTPIVVDGTMYVITPTGIVAALDPATGAERWRYDAGVNPHRGYGDFASRGVSFWRDSRAAAGTACARRIIAATIDRAAHRPRMRRQESLARLRLGRGRRGRSAERAARRRRTSSPFMR